MIDANSKTNSFLKAIEKYAEEQKNAMKAETEAFREEQLRHANEEGTQAAHAFIQKEKAEIKAFLAKENSLKETAIKRELFEKRSKMVKSIFKEAEKKLREFTKTKKYEAYLNNSAKSIAEYAAGKYVTVYYCANDEKFLPIIKKYFAKAEFVADSSIKIGGLRGFCEELSIVADETLDSKFETQKQEFVATSGFTIE
ncbi:MAG: hypothetical protein VZR27_05455 [Acutalibacteraceae bacterium]|nr:hypothetical protein [Acutalibacteraceae bacterium]